MKMKIRNTKSKLITITEKRHINNQKQTRTLPAGSGSGDPTKAPGTGG
jgi:hypothetical protein